MPSTSRFEPKIIFVLFAALTAGLAVAVETGTGLKGDYFDGTDLRNFKFSRVDPKIDFDWNEPADKRIGRENFSVRWTGALLPKFSETYTFHTISDDGVVLWVDGQALIDNWTNHAATEDQGTIQLQAGKKYNIKLEYYQGQSLACTKLLWSSRRQPREIVPPSQLFPDAVIDQRRANAKLNITLVPLKIADAVPSFENLQSWPQALAALEFSGVPGEWILLGPRPDREFKIYNRRPLDPELSDDWSVIPSDESGNSFNAIHYKRPAAEESPAYVDISVPLGRDNQALVYARTEVEWPADGNALLWYDDDGKSQIFVNNERVFTNERVEQHTLHHCAAAHMKQGRNVVKIKTGQNFGAWGFGLRLERNDPAYRIALLQKLIERFPDDVSRVAESKLEIARHHEELSHPQDAIAVYTALLAAPCDDEIRLAADEGIARCQAPALPAGAAQEAWKRAEQKYQESLRAGDCAGADEWLREHAARHPFDDTTGTALVYRGALRQDFGIGDDSRWYFQRAQREFPLNPSVQDFASPGIEFAENQQQPRRNYETSADFQAPLDAARRQMNSGNHDDVLKAARTLTDAVKVRNGALVRLGDSHLYPRFCGTGEFVRRLVESAPKDPRATFSDGIQAVAMHRFKAAADARDISALNAVADEFPETSAETLALNFAGNLLLDRAHFAEAADFFERVARKYTALREVLYSDGGVEHARQCAILFAKLALANLHAGQYDATRAALARLEKDFGAARLDYAGAQLSGAELARKIAQKLPPPEAVPHAGSTPYWTLPLRRSTTMDTARNRAGANPFPTLQSHPLIADGKVFITNLEYAGAIDVKTGARVWNWGWVSNGWLIPNQFTGYPVSCPAYRDGKLYMRAVEGKIMSLRCYAGETGRMRWTSAGNPELRPLIWLCDPVISHGLAIALCAEHTEENSNTHSIVALDAAGGELRWKHAIASGTTGIRIGNEYFASSMQMGPPVVEGGIVYALTGINSVCAYEVLGGEPVWISGYPSMQIADAERGNSHISDSVRIRTQKLFSRGAVSPVVAGGMLVVAPKDSPGIIGLDRQSGEIRWRHEMLDCRYLAGPFDGTVLALDDTLRAVRAIDGKVLWEHALPEPLYGQPLLSQGILYVSTKSALHVIDARTGKENAEHKWDALVGPAGNICISGETMAGVSERAVIAFGGDAKSRVALPLEEAKTLAAGKQYDAAAEKYLQAAQGASEGFLDALNGLIETREIQSKGQDALIEAEKLLAGKPELLESSSGLWKVSKTALANGLRERLGQPALPARQETLPGGLGGMLGYAWQFEADEPRMTVPNEFAASRELFCSASKSLYLFRIAGRPQLLWQSYVGIDFGVVTSGRRYVVVNDLQVIAAADHATGRNLWSVSLQALRESHHDVNLEYVYAVAIGDEYIALLARDGLFCFDARSGRELWWNKVNERNTLGIAFVQSAADRTHPGILAEVSGCGGKDTEYIAYDAKTGSVLRKEILNSRTEWTGSASSPDGRRLVFRVNPHELRCIDFGSGKTLWTASVPNLAFQWGRRNLWWGNESVYFHGENEDQRDKHGTVCELDPNTGTMLREHPAGFVRMDDDYLAVRDGGYGKMDVSRVKLQPGNEWKPIVVWTRQIPEDQAQGCRQMKALLSAKHDRLYMLQGRDSASSHFVLRTFDWKTGQLLADDMLPGRPFRNGDYAGSVESAGNELIYTGADGIYALRALAENRHDSALALKNSLSDTQPRSASERADLHRSLAGIEPVMLHAVLAPADLTLDGVFNEWEPADALALDKPENYVPLVEGAAWKGADDLSAKIYAAWNNNGLFICADVRDDSFVPPESGAELNSGDCVRFALNASSEPRRGYDARETLLCSLALIDGKSRLRLENAAGDPVYQMDAVPVARIHRAPDGKGLRYELNLPWPLLRRDPSLRPGNCKDLRLGAAIYDNDRGDTRGALEWGGGITRGAVFPPWLGQLSLLDVSRERIERYRKVVRIIPDTSEAMQYLRLILSSRRGENAARARVQVLKEFLKAHPQSRNVPRVLSFLRSTFREIGDADPLAQTIAAAKAARCPAPVIEMLGNKEKTDQPGTGLEGEYYDNIDFTNLKVARTDPVVNFDWNNNSPDPSMARDTFSVRWTGQVRPRFTEEYTFHTMSDDGVRLWVDSKLLIDNWTDHPPTENTGTILLAAGLKYDIKLEYFQGYGGAVAGLAWSSQSQAKEVVPQDCLFAPAGQIPAGPAGPAAQPNNAAQEPPASQAAYREAARLLADSPDGWALLRKVLDAYPAGALEPRIAECEKYVKDFPAMHNAAEMFTVLGGLYTQAGRDPQKSIEALMQRCGVPREIRRLYYSPRIPAWTQWQALGPFQAQGENRGMEEATSVEKAVDLNAVVKGPLDLLIKWTKIGRAKDEQNPSGTVDLWHYLIEPLPNHRDEITSQPYFAYVRRKITLPAPRRAMFYFGVYDTLSIWLNGKRVVPQSSPGNAKDSQAVEVTLKEGDNEILIKAGAPSGRVTLSFRIADANGRPFDDLPQD